MAKSQVLEQVLLKPKVPEFRIENGKVIQGLSNDLNGNGSESGNTIVDAKTCGIEQESNVSSMPDATTSGIEQESSASSMPKEPSPTEANNNSTEPSNSTIIYNESGSSVANDVENRGQESESIDFIEDDLEIGFMIHENEKGTVHRAVYKGKSIIVKLSRANKNYLHRRLKEVEIYKKLKSLQGECIPQLLFHGYLKKNNGRFCIGISNCGGRIIGSITTEQFIQVEESLLKIHKLGIAHRSIDKRNFAMDKDGKIWIIDFDNASVVTAERMYYSQEDLVNLRYSFSPFSANWPY